jgi:hypothetical protein
MASYNHEAYIGYAIQSVLNQTYADWELIIVDDASSDGTVAVARRYRDPRIQVEANTANQGQFAATNQAMALAQGRYWCILNSDDAFCADKLATQVAHLDANPGIAAVFTNAELIGEDNRPFTGQHSHQDLFLQENRTRHGWLHRFFYEGNCWCHPSVMIRADVQKQVGPYTPCFANLSDQDLWVRLCLSHDVHVLPDKLTQFRIRAGEANTGARKPSTIKRIAWEKSRILNHYLKLHTWDEVALVFPEAKAQFPWDALLPCPELIPYVIAQMALQTKKAAHHAFAMTALFDVMDDPDKAKLLVEVTGFGYPDLIRLSGQKDPFQLMPQQQWQKAKRHPLLKTMRFLGMEIAPADS